MDCKSGKFSFLIFKLKLCVEEELAVFLTCSVFYIAAYFIVLLPFIIVYTFLKWKVSILFWLAYFLWTRYDSETPNAAGRKIPDVENWKCFNGLGKYYPIRLIKVADLTPDRNYILAAFPHGVIPFATACNFLSNTNKRRELFPGIEFRVATMAFFFHFPLAREIFMAFGFCSVNKKDISRFLNRNPAKAILIWPGGNREALLSHPGSIYTIVKNRYGFVKAALESGMPLVPVFSFGEQNVFDQSRINLPRSIVKFLYKLTRHEQLIFKGRGFFQDKFGILPHRRPITTVVGKPIEVPKVENPSPELVNEYREKFYKALFDLFEEYKHKCDEAGDAAQLNMVTVGER